MYAYLQSWLYTILPSFRALHGIDMHMCSYGSLQMELNHWYLNHCVILYSSAAIGLLVLSTRIMAIWLNVHLATLSFTSQPRLELIWTLIPVALLLVSTCQSLVCLYGLEADTGHTGTYRSITGRQWYWTYGSPECSTGTYDSRMVAAGDLGVGASRLSLTQQPLYLESHTRTSLAVTSGDVLHSWSVPALGVKLDAIPGRSNRLQLNAMLDGTYNGYCAELCGVGHGFMPITVVVYAPAETHMNDALMM